MAISTSRLATFLTSKHVLIITGAGTHSGPRVDSPQVLAVQQAHRYARSARLRAPVTRNPTSRERY
jgi:hypothetical protein